MLTGRLLDVSTADIDMEVRPGVGPSPGLSFEAVSLAPKPHRFIVVGFTITLARSRRLGLAGSVHLSLEQICAAWNTMALMCFALKAL